MMVDAISVTELRRRLKAPKPSKFHNIVCREDGHTFDSEAERERYRQLKLLQRGGAIDGLVVHPRYPLDVNGCKICVYEGDFGYVEDKRIVIEDEKGAQTAVFKLKAKLFRAIYPHYDLRIIPVR